MSLDQLLAEGLITTLQSFQSSGGRPRQSSRPPPRNATRKLLSQGLLVEEQLLPSQSSSKLRQNRRLSTARTLISEGMESRLSSSSGKWYNSTRLSFSSKSKNDSEAHHTPTPEQLRQQAQSPQELFEAQLGKHFNMRRLGGLQTIRRAPKLGL